MVKWLPPEQLPCLQKLKAESRLSSPARRAKRVEGRGQASKQMSYFVYMLASKRNGTLYTGVTNALARRAGEHRDKQVPGFTKKYGVDILVWYEIHDSIAAAIEREKQVKGWNRAWKVRLIEENNSGWNDLAPGLV